MPSEANRLVFKCPQCGENIAYPQDRVGHKYHCPACLGMDFIPPQSSAAPHPETAGQRQPRAPFLASCGTSEKTTISAHVVMVSSPSEDGTVTEWKKIAATCWTGIQTPPSHRASENGASPRNGSESAVNERSVNRMHSRPLRHGKTMNGSAKPKQNGNSRKHHPRKNGSASVLRALADQGFLVKPVPVSKKKAGG